MAVKTVDVGTVAKLMHSEQAELIDVRTPAEFETLHAQGAKLFPLDRLDPKAVMSARSSADKPLYIICKSGGRSAQACEKFISAGFENVVSVAGGTTAWAAAGLPTESTGRRTLPLDRQMQATAGTICLTGAVLGYAVSPWFYLLCAMVGAGLTMAGLTGFCPMMILLSRMPWNRGASCGGSCCSR